MIKVSHTNSIRDEVKDTDALYDIGTILKRWKGYFESGQFPSDCQSDILFFQSEKFD